MRVRAVPIQWHRFNRLAKHHASHHMIDHAKHDQPATCLWSWRLVWNIFYRKKCLPAAVDRIMLSQSRKYHRTYEDESRLGHPNSSSYFTEPSSSSRKHPVIHKLVADLHHIRRIGKMEQSWMTPPCLLRMRSLSLCVRHEHVSDRHNMHSKVTSTDAPPVFNGMISRKAHMSPQ